MTEDRQYFGQMRPIFEKPQAEKVKLKPIRQSDYQFNVTVLGRQRGRQFKQMQSVRAEVRRKMHEWIAAKTNLMLAAGYDNVWPELVCESDEVLKTTKLRIIMHGDPPEEAQ